MDNQISRRSFLMKSLVKGLTLSALSGLTLPSCLSQSRRIMTVTGEISSDQLGRCLIHEHILVDFIGATQTGYHRWNRDEVRQVVAPFLSEIKSLGYSSLFECTPAFLGRDPILLKELSQETGLYIITNTGYYGARSDLFLSPAARIETAEMLSEHWIAEWESGIESTGIKPGFIKIGVDPAPLSAMHQKIVRAAAKTHLVTGLTIAGHTGAAPAAFEEFDLLEDEGLSLNAFIWVHAQAENDLSRHVEAAKRGAWVSLDGVSNDSISSYVEMIRNMKENGLLSRLLISHDAGWYSPEEMGGGSFRPYNAIERMLLPALKEDGFSDKDIAQLLVENPVEAFGIRVRKK